MTSSDEEVHEFSPDKPLAAVIGAQVLEMLKQSDDAAYRVYLVLATRFGAGQRI